MTTKHVTLTTDGSCHGNPGPGGWATMLHYNGSKKIISGGEPHTTNNRMELRAVIEGLEALRERCRVTVVTDSKYVMTNLASVPTWKARGWKTIARKPVANQDLWEKLHALSQSHEVQFTWVKGHSGHEDNETVDRLANEAAMAHKRRPQ